MSADTQPVSSTEAWKCLPPAGYQPNPGSLSDASAIMHEWHAGGEEVNRFEPGRYNAWDPPLWNE